jgi:glycosidase
MQRFFTLVSLCCVLIMMMACQPQGNPQTTDSSTTSSIEQETELTVAQDNSKPQKVIIYQVMTRLFGNTNTTNKTWGSISENGVGKFNDFSDKALQGIKELSVTHIWFTGVLEHATTTDYTDFGIDLDDPDVIKGRAGSPYAIKDYYDVNPDMAEDPAQRMAEFEALIARAHQNGLKVIIDIVPNHVARHYQSSNKPDYATDFGAKDNKQVEYARDNHFYYIPEQAFVPPVLPDEITPALHFSHPLADSQFDEFPAKWTGNGARSAQPKADDWYETAKLNYGVRPDGSQDFPELPDTFREADAQQHAAFWADKPVPDTWQQMRYITQFWLDKGVDGFRYDVAELVPVAFWSYLNSHIKNQHPNSLLLAEVYNPDLYRDFIYLGKMDYLYDKVGFYDSVRALSAGQITAAELELEQQRHQDIHPQLLRFLENHDEQRLASPEFIGSAQAAKPALAASLLSNSGPFLLYFGQEVGEDGSEDGGFGDPSRTSIFDYVGVPAHQRWMNMGQFDGGLLSEQELSLRGFHQEILQFSRSHPALFGEYLGLQAVNIDGEPLSDTVFAFARWTAESAFVLVTNFDLQHATLGQLVLPESVQSQLNLSAGQYQVKQAIAGQSALLEIAETNQLSFEIPPSGLLLVDLTHAAITAVD